MRFSWFATLAYVVRNTVASERVRRRTKPEESIVANGKKEASTVSGDSAGDSCIIYFNLISEWSGLACGKSNIFHKYIEAVLCK